MANSFKEEMLARKEEGARYFWEKVRPLIEKIMKVKVLPLEQLPDNEVTEAFDKAGIDAFYVERGILRGIASRMRYDLFGGCSFTFRYGVNGEYQRRYKAVHKPAEHILFPHLHVESFLDKKSGKIVWSYAAETEALIKYIAKNREIKDKVKLDMPPKYKNRKVVIVPISMVRKECRVIELQGDI